MFTIDTSIAIDAPPVDVWHVLLDFPRYHEWNTLLAFVGGEPTLGNTLILRLTPPTGRGYTFKPVVTNHLPPTRFSWKGITGVPGVFDGEHFFELSPLPGNRTQLINREVYSGLVSPIMQRLPLLRDAKPGFERMNEQLKQRVEHMR